MKKVFLLLGLMSVVALQAQDIKDIKVTPKNSWFKAGLNLGVPVSETADYASFNVGLDVRGQYLVTPHFGIGLASGYNHFFAKDEFEDFGLIPAAVFLRYYFTPSGLFFGADFGYGFLTNVENNSGGLYVNPQIGYHNRDWNLYAFYQNTFAENDINLQTVGVGATYNIRFK